MAELLFKVRADTGNTASALQRLITPLTSIGKQSDKASASLNKLGKTDVTPEVDTKAISTAISTAEKKLASLRATMVEEVTLGLDTKATTTAIRRVESDLKALRAQKAKIPVQVDTTKATTALGRLKQAMASLRTGLGTGLKKVGAGFSSLGSGVSSFFSNLNVPLVGAVGVGLTLLASKAAGAAAGMLQLADTMENNKIAFETLLGSGAKADQFLQKLQAFGNATPFEFPELVAASKKLLAFGFAGKDIIPLMTTLGDAAANTGADVEALAVIFGQMKAKGKLATEDILQLVEAGIPAWGILADKMGLTVAQVQDLATKGKLGAKEFKALQEGMDETFGGGMEKSAATLSGMISTLQDTWAGIQTKIGEAFLPLVKSIMPNLTGALENVGKAIMGSLPAIVDGVAHAADSLVGLPQVILNGLATMAMGISNFVAGVQRSFGDVAGAHATAAAGTKVWQSLKTAADNYGAAVAPLKTRIEEARKAAQTGLVIQLKTQEVDAKLTAVNAKIKDFTTKKNEAKLDADKTYWDKKLQAAKREAADLKKQKAQIPIDAKIDGLTSKLATARSKLSELAKKKSTPEVRADISKFEKQRDKAIRGLATLSVKKANPKLDANSKAFKDKVAAAEKKMKAVDKSKATANIYADDKTGPGVKSAKSNVNSVKDKTVKISVQTTYSTRGKKGTTADIGPGASMAPTIQLTAPAAPPPTVVVSVRDEALADFLDVRINGHAVHAARVLRRRDLVTL